MAHKGINLLISVINRAASVLRYPLSTVRSMVLNIRRRLNAVKMSPRSAEAITENWEQLTDKV